jgi:hypothetical protein
MLQYVTLSGAPVCTQFFRDITVISITYAAKRMVGTVVDLFMGQQAAQRIKKS